MIDRGGAFAAALLCWMFARARQAYETTEYKRRGFQPLDRQKNGGWKPRLHCGSW